MKTERFTVSGMTCAACVASVERTVLQVSGVSAVTVSLLGGFMNVTYDDQIAQPAQIVRAVVSAGYRAALPNELLKKDTDVGSESKSVRLRLIVSFAFLIPLMALSMGHMLSWPLPKWFLGPNRVFVFAFTQFLLALPIALVNQKFFTCGFRALFHGNPNMDSLIAVGSGAAYLYGVYALYGIGIALGDGDFSAAHAFAMDLYFESGAMVLSLVTLGKFFEARAKGRTSQALAKLRALAPTTARVEADGQAEDRSLSEIRVGDVVQIRPGEGIPVDGRVLTGQSSIDQSAMTGESLPVEVEPGSLVRAGTINQSGFLRVEVQKTGEETTLSQIIRMVEDASASKAPIARLADRISAYFVPAVLLLAFVTCAVWLLAGATFSFALINAISVLVISCPCALGLATPVAVTVGAGRGASLGILFKSAEALEKTQQATAVVLDKTGTLTSGKPRVTATFTVPGVDAQTLLHVAAALEQPSAHPLAQAILTYAKTAGIDPEAIERVDQFEALHGLGVRGVLGGRPVSGGNARMMREAGVALDALTSEAETLALRGATPMFFEQSGRAIGLVAVSDTAKPDSAQAVSRLVELGLTPVMLTGDNLVAARAIADQMGIPEVLAEVLPGDKALAVKRLQAEGRHVLMVGDGVNDAPALTQADVGVAIGAGSDIALESADIVLLNSRLTDAVSAFTLSRAVIRNIRENLFWAFLYNTALIPLAAGVFYPAWGWRLSPMLGAAAMSLSSVCVVLNALRLLRFHGEPSFDACSNDTTLESSTYKEEKPMTYEKTLEIEGMMCAHCQAHVEQALNALPGVTAEVSLADKNARAQSAAPLDDGQLRQAVEAAGYRVTAIR